MNSITGSNNGPRRSGPPVAVTNDPERSSADPNVPGRSHAVARLATAPRLLPPIHAVAGLVGGGRTLSTRRDSTSSTTKRACSSDAVYSRLRWIGSSRATTEGAHRPGADQVVEHDGQRGVLDHVAAVVEHHNRIGPCLRVAGRQVQPHQPVVAEGAALHGERLERARWRRPASGATQAGSHVAGGMRHRVRPERVGGGAPVERVEDAVGAVPPVTSSLYSTLAPRGSSTVTCHRSVSVEPFHGREGREPGHEVDHPHRRRRPRRR